MNLTFTFLFLILISSEWNKSILFFPYRQWLAGC